LRASENLLAEKANQGGRSATCQIHAATLSKPGDLPPPPPLSKQQTVAGSRKLTASSKRALPVAAAGNLFTLRATKTTRCSPDASNTLAGDRWYQKFLKEQEQNFALQTARACADLLAM
jgi:hypothetical protein